MTSKAKDTAKAETQEEINVWIKRRRGPGRKRPEEKTLQYTGFKQRKR